MSKENMREGSRSQGLVLDTFFIPFFRRGCFQNANLYNTLILLI